MRFDTYQELQRLLRREYDCGLNVYWNCHRIIRCRKRKEQIEVYLLQAGKWEQADLEDIYAQ